MDTSDFILYLCISTIIGLAILYFIIKLAIKSAIREFGCENRKNQDIDVKIAKILAEIAKNNGVSQDTINNILIP